MFDYLFVKHMSKIVFVFYTKCISFRTTLAFGMHFSIILVYIKRLFFRCHFRVVVSYRSIFVYYRSSYFPRLETTPLVLFPYVRLPVSVGGFL